jgi:hypothetical protein
MVGKAVDTAQRKHLFCLSTDYTDSTDYEEGGSLALDCFGALRLAMTVCQRYALA